MEITELLEGLASFTTKAPQEFIGSLKTENGEWKPIGDIRAAVEAAITEKLQSVGTDQYKRGEREKAQKLEGWAKSKFGFQSTEVGEQFWESLVTDQVGKVEPTIKEVPVEKDVTFDQIKEREDIKEWLQSSVQTAVAGLTEERDNAINSFAEYKKAQSFQLLKSLVDRKALETLQASKAILGEDEETQSKRINAFYRMIDYGRYKLNEAGDDVIVVDESGNQAKDKHFNPITFESDIKELNPYGFHTQDTSKRSQSPNTQTQSSQHQQGGGDVPVASSYAELMEMRLKEKDPAKRAAMTKAFRESQQNKQ